MPPEAFFGGCAVFSVCQVLELLLLCMFEGYQSFLKSRVTFFFHPALGLAAGEGAEDLVAALGPLATSPQVQLPLAPREPLAGVQSTVHRSPAGKSLRTPELLL